MPDNSNTKNGWGLNKKVSVGTVIKVGTLIVTLIVAVALTEYRLRQVEAKTATFITREKFEDCMTPMKRDIAELRRDVKKILENQEGK